jgi:hypothetical protein
VENGQSKARHEKERSKSVRISTCAVQSVDARVTVNLGRRALLLLVTHMR